MEKKWFCYGSVNSGNGYLIQLIHQIHGEVEQLVEAVDAVIHIYQLLLYAVGESVVAGFFLIPEPVSGWIVICIARDNCIVEFLFRTVQGLIGRG